MRYYILAALVILTGGTRSVGTPSAVGTDLKFTKLSSNSTGLSFNSTLRNDSSENCNTFSATSSSALQDNTTSNVSECLQNEPLDESDSGQNRAVAPVYVAICLGLWAVLANSLPPIAIIKHEQLHIPVYILMANLAASDVLTGIAFVLSGSSILYVINNEIVESPVILRLRFTSIILSGLSSAYSLMALTAERYWFIVHGMTYVNSVTNDKCKVVIVIVWVWSVLLAMLPTFGWHCAGHFEEGCLQVSGGLPYSYVVVILVFIFIPMAAIVFFNMGIFWCLWNHMNDIADQEAAVGAPPSVNRKSAFTVVLITVVFMVGWLPYSIKISTLPEDRVALSQMYVFVILNSAINPVIYAFRLKEVRQGVVRLLVNNSGNADLAVD